MQKAFKIHCFCSLEKRIDRIQKIYQEKMTPLKFKECLAKISPYISVNFRQDLLKVMSKENGKGLLLCFWLIMIRVIKSHKK